MKKIGVVKAVLAGKTVPYAHGAQSAINKQVLPERQHATELGFTSDEPSMTASPFAGTRICLFARSGAELRCLHLCSNHLDTICV